MDKKRVLIPEMLFFQEGPGVRNTQYTDSGVKLLNVANLVDGRVDLSTSNRYISEEEAYGKYNHFLVDEGDFIIASSGIKVEYFDKKMGFVDASQLPLCMNTSTIRFKVLEKEKLNIRYFMYYLKSQDFKNQLSRQITGSAQLNFGPSHLKKMKFPLVGIGEQNDICCKLDKIVSIVEKRQEQLEKFDLLIKARFVELFGNPLDGTAKYPIHQVGEVANSVDPQPSHRTPPVEEGGIPYVSIKDCDYKTGKIDFEGARKVSPKVLEEHMNRYTLHDGDFVVGKIGTIGNPVFVPARNDYTLSANVVLIQPNSELVSPYFLKYSFESDFVERQFAEAKNSTSQAAFGIQKVRTVEVMNPDLDVQREFEIFVKQVDKTKFVQNAIDRFSKTDSYPQIAISVDMLDTGIDVPDIVNLVFFKKVRSKAKFWQMIGRGTRLRTDLFGPGDDKKGFLIFDYLGNMDYFRVDQRPEKSGIIESLSQRIYKLRVDILYALEQNASDQDYVDEINKQIKEMSGYIQSLNEDSFNVKMHLKYVHQYKNPDNWINLNEMDTHYIKDELSSLVVIHDEDKRAKFFDRQMYMIEMAYLNHYDASQVINKVIMMADELYKKQTTPDIADNAEYLKCAKDPDYWKTANYFDLEVLREKIRGLVKYLDPGPIVDPVDTHFEDEIIETKMNDAFYNDEGLENYKEKVQHYLKAHEDDEAIYKLRHNQVITPDEMKHLENLLWIDLGSKDDYRLHFGDTPITRLIRKIVGLDRQAAMAEFSRFLDDQSLNSRQIHFVELLVDYIVKNGFIEDKKVLLQDPFKSIGSMSALFKDKMNIAREILKTVDTFSERL